MRHLHPSRPSVDAADSELTGSDDLVGRTVAMNSLQVASDHHDASMGKAWGVVMAGRMRWQ